MKTKNCAIFIAILLTQSLFAQLRIDPTGRIGIGWNWPNPGYKVHVKGNVLLTTYPELPEYPGGEFIELRMKVGNGNPGAEIGTNVDKIAFWSSETTWNKLYAQQYYVESDSSSKERIRRFDDATTILKGIHAYKYEMRNKVGDELLTRYGLLAQEVRAVMPEATDSAKGILMVDYAQMIPLLVQAVQMGAVTIDSLRYELALVQEEIAECCVRSHASFESEERKYVADSQSILYQNTPNPFQEKTTVEYELLKMPESTASIMIFDMNGHLKRTYPISLTIGRGSVEIHGGELAAGMYLYSLLVDGNEIDTKRMILTD